MFTWFRRRQEERAAFLAALHAIRDVSIANAAAQQEMSKAFRVWMESFQVNAAPEMRENSDVVAWQSQAVAKMEAAGLPVGATELERLEWLATQMDAAV